mgnify:CR=1 FL=1
MLTVATCLILLPLVGALLAVVLGFRGLGRLAHLPVWTGLVLAAMSAICLTMLHGQSGEAFRDVEAYRWLDLGVASTAQAGSAVMGAWSAVGFTYRVDGLSLLMLLTVTIVAVPIAVYAKGYMDGDGGYARFFAVVGLFVAGMCTLVLAGNLLVLYLGWEMVGLCSYLLIGHYYRKPSARAAAMKAFVVNRIGDAGLLLGVLLLYKHTGSVEFSVVLAPETLAMLAERPLFDGFGMSTLTAACLLLLCGAVGKSAQLPLYTWLPDAMEGPSPVSALIHAATMVTAGVYLVARMGPAFGYSDDGSMSTPMVLVLGVGMASAIFAAMCALGQYDLKRILAYSTMSQLGFMFVALGCGRPDAAIFHLYTHAFFKALLFLGAGVVMHALHGGLDLREMGGLRRRLPLTCGLMVIGSAALAGVPLLAGFFSKDEILHAGFAQSPLAGVLLLLTAGLTAFYSFRLVFWAFFGEEKLPASAMHDGKAQLHLPSGLMLGSLVFLAAGSVLAGYAGVVVGSHGFLGVLTPGGETIGLSQPAVAVAPLHGLLEPAVSIGAVDLPSKPWLAYASGGVALLAIGLAWVVYGSRRAGSADPAARALGGVFEACGRSFSVDQAYDAAVVGPTVRAGVAADRSDRTVLSGLVGLIGLVPTILGHVLRIAQSGRMQGYARTMLIGSVLVLLGTLYWSAAPAAMPNEPVPASPATGDATSAGPVNSPR